MEFAVIKNFTDHWAGPRGYTNLILGTGDSIWESNPWIMRTYRVLIAELHRDAPSEELRNELSEKEYDAFCEPFFLYKQRLAELNGLAKEKKEKPPIQPPETLSEEQLKSFCGPGVFENLATLGITEESHPGIPALINRLYGILHDVDGGRKAVIPYAQMALMVKKLREEEINVFVLGEKRTSAIETGLRVMGIFDDIAAFRGLDSDGERVPRMEIFERLQSASREIGITITPENTVVADGREINLKDPVDLGYACIGLNWGKRAPEERHERRSRLLSVGARLVASKPEGLLAALNRLESRQFIQSRDLPLNLQKCNGLS